MGMFSLDNVKETKVVSNNFLKSGIHKVYFKGIFKSEKIANAMEARFEAVDGSGIHNETIFEPRSEERTESQYGPNPSEAEQFQCRVKQIMMAVYPDLAKQIDEGKVKLEAVNFDGFIQVLASHLNTKIGVETNIKLIPNKSGYASMPGFIGRVNKDGVLYMSTKIIGEDLSFTTSEMKTIDAFAKAKPTDMKSTNSSNTNELDDLSSDFGSNTTESDNSEDDLPF